MRVAASIGDSKFAVRKFKLMNNLILCFNIKIKIRTDEISEDYRITETRKIGLVMSSNFCITAICK